MPSDSEPLPPSARADALEKELAALKRQYAARLRELSAMASLRETVATSILQASIGQGSKSCSPNELTGPSFSPNDSNFSSQSPPCGAEVTFLCLPFIPLLRTLFPCTLLPCTRACPP